MAHPGQKAKLRFPAAPTAAWPAERVSSADDRPRLAGLTQPLEGREPCYCVRARKNRCVDSAGTKFVRLAVFVAKADHDLNSAELSKIYEVPGFPETVSAIVASEERVRTNRGTRLVSVNMSRS